MPEPGLPGPGDDPAAMACDYDTDPGRFAANLAIRRRFGGDDVFGTVAQALAATPGAGPVLELGGGTGPLARQLAGTGIRVVVADLAAHLAAAPRPAVRTDAAALGLRPGCFGTVAALWMLYHLPDPMVALREAARVLRPGGCFVACTASRFNDPELAPVLPGWGRPSTFDAENAASQVGQVFQITGTTAWDKPLIRLPEAGDIELYLRGRGLSPADASDAAARTSAPLLLTKRGVLIWARKPPGPGRETIPSS